jgi:hypothetical protein
MFSNIIILLLKSSPHFLLLLFPNTYHCLICIVHYFSDMCLIRGSIIEYVAQVFELFYSFYFPSFPVPLNLFTLPLSLVEHHHFDLLNIHFQLFLPHILSQVLHHFFHFSFALCHNYQVSSPNARLQTSSLPITLPPACAIFFNFIHIFDVNCK